MINCKTKKIIGIILLSIVGVLVIALYVDIFIDNPWWVIPMMIGASIGTVALLRLIVWCFTCNNKN